jgi:hypothetical protein
MQIPGAEIFVLLEYCAPKLSVWTSDPYGSRRYSVLSRWTTSAE